VDVVDAAQAAAQRLGVKMTLDYVEMNDPQTFDVLGARFTREDMSDPSDPVILSGAMWVGKTRLIDNIVLGDANQILGRKS